MANAWSSGKAWTTSTQPGSLSAACPTHSCKVLRPSLLGRVLVQSKHMPFEAIIMWQSRQKEPQHPQTSARFGNFIPSQAYINIFGIDTISLQLLFETTSSFRHGLVVYCECLIIAACDGSMLIVPLAVLAARVQEAEHLGCGSEAGHIRV